eukprot:8810551-Pyramimonas_sp.AAC.1
MGSRMRKLYLRGLGYPAADTFAVEDTGKYRQLVVWLEDTKVWSMLAILAEDIPSCIVSRSRSA